MRRLFAIVALALAVAAPSLRAQEEGIFVSGTVRNLHTERPEPYCIVQLLQAGVSKTLRLTDEEGYFYIDNLQPGRYTLHVSAGHFPLYQADLDFFEDANLDILVDTVKSVSLPSISIFANRKPLPLPGHMLSASLITSPSDSRLWNFSGNMTDNGPASEDLSNPGGGNPFKKMLLYGTAPCWQQEVEFSGKRAPQSSTNPPAASRED